MKNMKKYVAMMLAVMMSVFIINPMTASAAKAPQLSEKYILKMTDKLYNYYNKVSYSLENICTDEEGEVTMNVFDVKYDNKKKNLVVDVYGYIVYELPDDEIEYEGSKELLYSYKFKKNMNTGKYSYKVTDTIGDADYTSLAADLNEQFVPENFTYIASVWFKHMLGDSLDYMLDTYATVNTEYPKFWHWDKTFSVDDYDAETGWVPTEISFYVAKKGNVPDDIYVRFVNIETDAVLDMNIYNVKFSK